jgi:hypothetical protein
MPGLSEPTTVWVRQPPFRVPRHCHAGTRTLTEATARVTLGFKLSRRDISETDGPAVGNRNISIPFPEDVLITSYLVQVVLTVFFKNQVLLLRPCCYLFRLRRRGSREIDDTAFGSPEQAYKGPSLFLV